MSSGAPRGHSFTPYLAVPTRGYVFHETANTLARLTSRAGMPLPSYVRGTVSVSDVRNRIVRAFLATEADVLIMCDDDVVPPDDAIPRLLSGLQVYDIVSGVVLIVRPGTVHLPNVFLHRKDKKGDHWDINMDVYGRKGLIQTDAVGTGLIAIRREVLEHRGMRAPFAVNFDKHGVVEAGEDLNFCRRARAQGFKIAVHMDVFCEHHTDIYANAIAQAYSKQIETLLDRKEVPDGFVPAEVQ